MKQQWSCNLQNLQLVSNQGTIVPIRVMIGNYSREDEKEGRRDGYRVSYLIFSKEWAARDEWLQIFIISRRWKMNAAGLQKARSLIWIKRFQCLEAHKKESAINRFLFWKQIAICFRAYHFEFLWYWQKNSSNTFLAMDPTTWRYFDAVLLNDMLKDATEQPEKNVEESDFCRSTVNFTRRLGELNGLPKRRTLGNQPIDYVNHPSLAFCFTK